MIDKTVTLTTITQTFEFTAEEIEQILQTHIERSGKVMAAEDIAGTSCSFDVNSAGHLRGATITVWSTNETNR